MTLDLRSPARPQLRAARAVRWLLAIAAALSLLGRAATTYASAGFQREVSCCCPDPDTCKCKHDPPAGDQPTMKRCAGGGHWTSVELAAADVPAPLTTAPVQAAARSVAPAPPAPPASRYLVPERPPF